MDRYDLPDRREKEAVEAKSFSIGATVPTVTPARRVEEGEEQRAYSQPLPGRQPVRYSQEQSPYQKRSKRVRTNTAESGDTKNKKTQAKLKKGKPKHTLVYAGIIFLCIILLAAIGVFMLPQLLGGISINFPNYAFANGRILVWDEQTQSTYNEYKTYLSRNSFFPGVYVDHVSLADRTLEEAKQQLDTTFVDQTQRFSVDLVFEDQTFTISSDQIPIHKNIDEVLEQAYAVGRQNSMNILGSGITPFAQRAQTAVAIRQSGVMFNTEMTYDKQMVKQQVEAFAESLNQAPLDAQLKSFDFATRTFNFTQEQDGYVVDGEKLYQQVIERLDRGEYGTSIQVEREVLHPKVSKVELMNNFKKISSSTTQTTSNRNRNTNIDLSAKALNGKVIYPGESLSFNEATGKRTAEGGYKEAVAISGGQNVPDIGGGVCQTSTTLFNAVLKADLEVVKRTPHAWPSSYVEIGMDATVNWPNLDFVFKNNQEYPIFIIAFYEDQTVTVEIYGKSLGQGIVIDLESEITKVIDPPSETKYLQNTRLAPGTQKQGAKARKGYESVTYKIWYQDGVEIKRESFESSYRMYPNTIEYN